MVKAFHLHIWGSQQELASSEFVILGSCTSSIRLSLSTDVFSAARAGLSCGIRHALARTSSHVPRTKTALNTSTLKAGQRLDYSPSRRSPRIKLQVPVFVRGADASGSEFIELTKTLNISATGACIASAHILRPDQTVHLTIPAPSPASSSASSVVPSETPPIAAKVRRQQTVGDLHLFGLEFLRALD
jgi:PilZ domain